MKSIYYILVLGFLFADISIGKLEAKLETLQQTDRGKSCIVPIILSKELDSIRQKSKDALVLLEDHSRYSSNEALIQDLEKQGVSKQQALKILNQAVTEARRQDPMLAENPKSVVEQKILQAALSSLDFHGYTSYVVPLLTDSSEYEIPQMELMKNPVFVKALVNSSSHNYIPLNQEFSKMICQRIGETASLVSVPQALAQNAACMSGEVSPACTKSNPTGNVLMIKYSFNGLRALAAWGADMIANRAL